MDIGSKDHNLVASNAADSVAEFAVNTVARCVEDCVAHSVAVFVASVK